MLSIEAVLAKAGARAASYIGRRALDQGQRRWLIAQLRPLVSRETFESFVDALRPNQASRFEAFLASAQFDHFALQMMSWHVGGGSAEALAELRNGVHWTLKERVGLVEEQLVIGTDLAVQLLTVATESARPSILPQVTGSIPTSVLAAIAADNAAAAVRASDLRKRIGSVAEVDRFASMLRSQVQHMRSKMRPTHLGITSPVEYARLHVDPVFSVKKAEGDEWQPIAEALRGSQRIVVLGDPGAGKSTFAAKLAYDIAEDAIAGFEGRVPFLLLARDLVELVRTERRPLAVLIERVAGDPYNVRAPRDAVEYLLLHGLAVVIVDGLDEFGDQAARQRLVDLVEGFAHLYPTVTVVVTSREIGYSDAPLDTDLFGVRRIAPFGPDQIEAYTRNWFGLDGDLSAADQAELAESFLRESKDVADLRTNPLVLSLLCSLYSSRHYIPRHRTEIYEQCAEMLFERWDQHRGIAVALRFASHMRPAIARLAWMMFNDRDHGQVVGRDRIIEFLTDYMMEERFDVRADAAAAVEEFLAVCAGRAWVLTEVGTRGGLPVYGFTHRTFLEYFAAVQLVRMGPDPDQVWDRLAGHLSDGSWSVVAHLAVQILDRCAEGGGSRFVERLALQAADVRPGGDDLVRFGTKVAAQLALRTPALRDLAREAVFCAGRFSTRARLPYECDRHTDEMLELADQPLRELLRLELPENAERAGLAVAEALLASDIDLSDRNHSFGVLAGYLAGPRFPTDGARAAARRLSQDVRVQRLAQSLAWPRSEEIRREGMSRLFRMFLFNGIGGLSPARLALIHTLADGSEGRSPEAVQALEFLGTRYEDVVSAPWPWLIDADRGDFREHYYVVDSDAGQRLMLRLDSERFERLDATQRSTAVLLLLPFAEDVDLDSAEVPEAARPFAALLAARRTGEGRDGVIEQITSWALRKKAHDFVVSWIDKKASPIAYDV